MMASADVIQGRYARQIVLPQVGEAGQCRIAGAVAVVAGLGRARDARRRSAGAGRGRHPPARGPRPRRAEQPAAPVPVRGGGRRSGAAEGRGRRAAAAADQLRRSGTRRIVDDINPATVERITEGATVVVDGLDNFYTRMLINESCVKSGVPLVYGACLATYGSAVTVIPGVSACLHCLFPDVAQGAAPPVTCETVGVLGPVAALIARVASVGGVEDRERPHRPGLAPSHSRRPLAQRAHAAARGQGAGLQGLRRADVRPARRAGAPGHRIAVRAQRRAGRPAPIVQPRLRPPGHHARADVPASSATPTWCDSARAIASWSCSATGAPSCSGHPTRARPSACTASTWGTDGWTPSISTTRRRRGPSPSKSTARSTRRCASTAANPGRGALPHVRGGAALVDDARLAVARLFNAPSPDRVVFTLNTHGCPLHGAEGPHRAGRLAS